MTEIDNAELKSIKGGGISIGLGIVIAGGVIVLAGIIDGIFRPYKCR